MRLRPLCHAGESRHHEPTRMRTTAKLCVLAVFCAASLGAAGVESNAALIEAAKAGNAGVLRTLLRQPGAVNLPEADGTTALHWAVRADHLESIQLLLRAGANASAANRYGVTPLSLAALNGSAAAIELLLKAGAD